MAERIRIFDFLRQQKVEWLVTVELLDAFLASLPKGWTMRRLTGNDQKRGDLELRCGNVRVYVELKAEGYAGSLFIEPIQFWRHGQSIRYKRSWAFTTTAQFMLYFSTKTGQLMLCPRADWLSAGLKLLEATLLSSKSGPSSACRPSVTVNTKLMGGERVFSGGAAGMGLLSTTWLRTLFTRLGARTDAVVLADGSALLRAARAKVLAMDDAAIANYAGFASDVAKQQGIVDELREWAKESSASSEDLALQNDLLNCFGELQGDSGPQQRSVEELLATATALGPELSAEPLQEPMWFLAAACLQCGWTKRPDDRTKEKKALKTAQAAVAMAQSLPVVLDETHVDDATAPLAARKTRLRFGRDFAAHGPRPSWEAVKPFVLETDLVRIGSQRKAYWSGHVHPDIDMPLLNAA